MVFIGLALFFAYLTYRAWFSPQITGTRFDLYFFIVFGLTIFCVSVPIRAFYFELKFAHAASELVKNDDISVHCISLISGIIYNRYAGFVTGGEPDIYLQGDTCEDLRSFLWDPKGASLSEQYALHVLTHETMHVAGILNEQKADCAAFQRNHNMAILLGVEESVAKVTAMEIHGQRSPRHPYYTKDCEPDGSLDERLPGAVWLKTK